MTVICYKDGVMAADSGLFIGDMIVSTSCRKLLLTKDGWLVGSSGSASISEDFEKWITGKRKEPFTSECADDFCAMVVQPDGTIMQHDDFDTPFTINSTYHAIGVGCEIAYGALAAGASAEEAVRITIEHHVWCAGTPHVIHLAGAPAFI